MSSASTMATLKHLSCLSIVCFCITVVKGAPIEDIGIDKSLLATNLDEFFRCHGFKCEVLDQTRNIVKEYKLAIADKVNRYNEIKEFLENNPEELDYIDDFIVTTEEAAESLENLKSRQKRKLATFNSKNQKWSSPIGYILHNGLSSTIKNTVRKAMSAWKEATCLEFREFPESYLPDGILSFITPEHNILYFHPGYQCASYVGRILWSQPIQLATQCGSNFGAVAHEIGHALGFWHEHQRADRDDYVSVYPENMQQGIDPWQVEQKGNTLDLVPYDYGSVMHYNAWAFTPMSNAVNKTIVPHNDMYLHTIGQKVEISFWDAKLANMAYCSVQPSGVSELCYHGIREGDCKNKGYQDPKDCTKCRCPDGFSGTYCENIEPPKNAICGGKFVVRPGADVTIETPNYRAGGYQDDTECTWHFETEENYRPVFHLDGENVGTYCYWTRPSAAGACYHWLEVRYQDLTATGPRLCCDRFKYKQYAIEGEQREMMILFRSNYATPYNKRGERLGFRARVSAECVKNCGNTPRPGPATTTTTTTTPRPTPSPTTRTTTRRTTTTTTRPTTTLDKHRGMTHCTKGNRDKRIDLAFVVDSSGSVGQDNWFRFRNFTLDVLSQYSIGPDCLQAGFVSYSTDGRIKMNFIQGSQSIDSIDQQLRTFEWMAGWSNTADGIRQMWSDLFTIGKGDRADVKNMCILLTDGKSTKDAWRTTSEAAKAKFGSSQVEIVVVGVTDKVEDAELESIASSPNDIFKVRSFSELSNDKLINDVLTKIDNYAERGPVPNITTNKDTQSKTSSSSSTSTSSSSSLLASSSTSSTSSKATQSTTTTTMKTSPLHDTTRLSFTPPPSSNRQEGGAGTQLGNKDEPESRPEEDEVSGSKNPEEWSWSCGFEDAARRDNDGFCGMTQDRQLDKFDWTITKDTTPSQETGPSRAESGSYYMYIEASSPRKPNDQAIIYMPPLATPGTYCLTFHYNMNGHHINELAVVKRLRNQVDRLWHVTGNHRDIWFKQSYLLYTSTPNEQFGLRGAVGRAFSGDIAIDNIHITKGLCAEE